tara:strand:+ start:222 stop:395 length:174 start_codon:yes stop_codon:yes gene_type:complete
MLTFGFLKSFEAKIVISPPREKPTSDIFCGLTPREISFLTSLDNLNANSLGLVFLGL